MPRLPLILAFVLAMAQPALALSPVDRNTIVQEATLFARAIRHGHFAAFFEIEPPRMIRMIAARDGLRPDQLETRITAAIAQRMRGVKVGRFALDLNQMQSGTTGKGRAYALIPTHALMTYPDKGTIRSESATLALRDHGEWYLVALDSTEQLADLRRTYPDLAALPLPRPKSTQAG